MTVITMRAQQPQPWCPAVLEFSAREWVWVASVLTEAQLVPPPILGSDVPWSVDAPLTGVFSQRMRQALRSGVVEEFGGAHMEVHVVGSEFRCFPPSPPGLDPDMTPSVRPLWEYPELLEVLNKVVAFMSGSGGFSCQPSSGILSP